ncbi:EAL domain-containing protein [Mycolicibacterium frederiksbergense]|uniref:EAL domain-containing protein n=1 Tax=Mycolicibacterium frederiksbergense TaxID=117567 RepID=UPI0021F27B8B|nr:EAL domain-containing protein [Mycolicibacterium frederiksbergense]
MLLLTLTSKVGFAVARLLRSAVLLIVFAAAYALAVVAGRATRVGVEDVALVWPAAAVAIIWVLTTRRHGLPERVLHVLVLGAVTCAVNFAADSPAPMSAWFGLVNIAQAVITVAILAHRRDEVVLRDPGDLARLLTAVAAGTVCAAALATAYFAEVLDAPAGSTFALFAVRNGASALLGLALWLRLQDLDWKRPRLSWSAVVEALVVGAGVTLVFVWIFWLNTGVPMAFLALVAAMWVTLRYSTTVSMTFLVVTGVWIIYATLLGKGVFIVQDLEARAMLSQAMVCSLTVIVLTLSLYRDSRARLIAQLRQARDLFAGVLQAASEQAIIGTDPRGHITVFNNGAERLLGWSEAEMLGRSPVDFHLEAEVRGRATQLGIPMGFEVFVHNVTPETAEVRQWTYVRRDGTHTAVSLAVSQMTNDDGDCAGYIGVATDVTEQKAAEQALAESEERFRLAFDTAPMGMFMFESSGRITRCNQAMAALLGRSIDDVLATTVTALGGTDGGARALGTLQRLLSLRSDQQFEAEVGFRHADGATVWGAVSASVVAPQGSSPYGMGLVEDITLRKLAEAELQHLAMHDRLTGLANRALFMERAETALADAAADDARRVGLIFLDLDGFKAVNDTWGHAQGDKVLATIARRIEASIRSRDTAARLGGDEFAVLCPDVSDIAHVQRVADRIRNELHRPVTLAMGGVYNQLSVSGGVAISTPRCTAEGLLQRADALMYQAKRSGKDCVALAETLEEAAMHRALQLIPELERAVNLHEFVVHFQPIVDLRTAEKVAAEALLRWQHPKRGLLKPSEFLAVAETSRQMSDIGRYVLYEACRHAAMWCSPMDTAEVHVNVSGRQLEVGDFRADVLEALERTGLAPDRLVLELTETYAGRVARSAKADLEALREIGVRVAIDDVGTGFSGLAKIVDLPIDILKIDKQFISGLPQDPRCEAITRAVLSLGESLGLSVIAEGIESREQWNLLADWGCEMGQGFLFGQAIAPRPAELRMLER